MAQKRLKNVKNMSENTKVSRTVKKVQKLSNENSPKCLENEPFYCKMNHCHIFVDIFLCLGALEPFLVTFGKISPKEKLSLKKDKKTNPCVNASLMISDCKKCKCTFVNGTLNAFQQRFGSMNLGQKAM